MAYIHTLRGPARGRSLGFVPGSLACAAARPLALSASIRWFQPASPVSPMDESRSPVGEPPAAPLSGDQS